MAAVRQLPAGRLARDLLATRGLTRDRLAA
jgi:hypothetical protein